MKPNCTNNHNKYKWINLPSCQTKAFQCIRGLQKTPKC